MRICNASVLQIVVAVCYFALSHSFTAHDEFELLARGSARILLGALKGSVELIRHGMKEEGDLHVVLDPKYAETLFKMGKVWVDYPKWPALHIAMNAGRQAHLNAAFFMLNHGADVHKYQDFISNPKFSLDVGYAPAMVYPLGFGGMPATQSHAALLQRLITTIPHKFNMTRIEEWRAHTGNPPLVHIPALLGNGGGLHVLINDFNLSVNQVDDFGVSPLHIAVWRGDITNVAAILSNNANRSAIDNYGRTALHYAVLRRSSAMIDMLMIFEEEMVTKSGMRARLDERGARRLRSKLLSAKDRWGKTPLSLAGEPPCSLDVQNKIKALMRANFVPIASHGENIDDYVVAHDAECSSEGEGVGEEAEDGGWVRYDLPMNVRSSPHRSEHDSQLQGKGGLCSFAKESPDIQDMKTSVPIDASITNDNHGYHGDTLYDDAVRDSDPGLTDLEGEDVQANSKQTFLRKYFYAQKPVLMTSFLLQNNHIWAHWRKDDFLNRYGALKVRVHVLNKKPVSSPSESPPPLSTDSITLREYVDFYMHSNRRQKTDENGEPSLASHSQAAMPGTATAQNVKILSEDIQRPYLFDVCGPRDKEPYSLFLGSSEAGDGPVSRGNASWHVVLAGTVRWTLWPPVGYTRTDVYLFGTETGDEEDEYIRKAAGQPSFDFQAEAAEKRNKGSRRKKNPFPKRRSTQIQLSEGFPGFNITQKQGQVLFIPHDWVRLPCAHHGDAIVASQEFCTLKHTDTRMQPLGHVIYGSDDPHRGIGRLRRDYSKIFGKAKELEGEVGGLPIFDNSGISIGG